MDTLLYVNQDLKAETDFKKVVAVVASFQEEDITDDSDLKGLYIHQPLINIAFFEPIGHDKSLSESLKLLNRWRERNYPQYCATLISYVFCLNAKKYGTTCFDQCWTRSRDDEGYPEYRTHPRAAWPVAIETEEKLPNVYVSLVMRHEDFSRLNPGIEPSCF